ncbi:MAG: response regulator receiver protein, partial [Mesorhizobium sp.]
RGVPLHDIDPNANVVNDLKKIILPEEAVATTAKSKSLFGLGKGLLKRKAG